MFEVRFFVDDKKLAKVMWALDGEIAGMPTIIPVRGAEVKGKTIKATTNGEGVRARLQESIEGAEQGTNYTRADITGMVVKLGAKSISASSYVSDLVGRGVLKRTGRGQYKRV